MITEHISKFTLVSVVAVMLVGGYLISAKFGIVPGLSSLKSNSADTQPVTEESLVQTDTQSTEGLSKNNTDTQADQVASENPEIPKASEAIIKWRTYRSAEYGFEFNYPGGYVVSLEDKYIYVDDPKNNLNYTIGISENLKNLTAVDYVEGALLDYGVTRDPVKKIIVNGIEGAETIARLGDIVNKSIYFPVKDKMINIQYHLEGKYFATAGAAAQKEIYIKNGDSLVSTFKLTK